HVEDVAGIVRPERVGRKHDRPAAAEPDAFHVALGDEGGIERPRIHDGVAPVAGDADRRPAHAEPGTRPAGAPIAPTRSAPRPETWLSRPRPAPGRARAAPRRPWRARLRRGRSRRRR